jgi:hypothetical protein
MEAIPQQGQTDKSTPVSLKRRSLAVNLRNESRETFIPVNR